MKNLLKPLAKSVLIPLGLTEVESATDAAIQKKMFGSGCRSDLALCTTRLIISNEEINDIMKIVKSLEESGLLIKGVCETIRKEANKQNGGFHSMLLDTLSTSLLENLFTGKSATRPRKGMIRAGQICNAAPSFNKL